MGNTLFLLIIAVNAVSGNDYIDEVSTDYDDQIIILQKQFAEMMGIRNYQGMGVEKAKDVLEQLGLTEVLKSKNLNVPDQLMCFVCQSMIRKLQRDARFLEVVAANICDLYMTLNTWTFSNFCREMIRINKPVLQYILENSKILTPEYGCSILMQNENCYYSHPALSWRIQIPEGGPTLRSQVPSLRTTSTMKILHLSDFHISFDYEVGGVSNCGYPVCCKRNLGNRLKGASSGHWGDYNCDIPPWLFTNTLHFINNTHKDIDMIYFTGDIIDHSIWKDSIEDNTAQIEFVFRQLAASFPRTPVMPAIGNHESIPLNQFAPPEISQQYHAFSQDWLYNINALTWSEWLPAEALATVQRQGYFSVMANGELRVIILNNNVCYIYNWWLLYDTNFLQEQLEFLKHELVQAEMNQQFVHIVAHVFPGDKECIEPWEASYNALITRFAHIIKGQFFGHTHTDGIKVFYSNNDGKPVNVGYNGASLTPFTKYNPNYKIITVDPVTFDTLDIETFYFNLTEANLHPDRSPRWQRLYSMKEAYSFSELSPENFHWLANRLPVDNYLFDQYWRYYVRDGDASIKEGCSPQCRKLIIDSITRTESLTYH